MRYDVRCTYPLINLSHVQHGVSRPETPYSTPLFGSRISFPYRQTIALRISRRNCGVVAFRLPDQGVLKCLSEFVHLIRITTRDGQCLSQLVVGPPKRISGQLNKDPGNVGEKGRVERIRRRIVPDAVFRVPYRRHNRFGRRPCPISKRDLWVDRTQVACRTHVDLIGTEHEQRPRTLCSIGNDHRELVAPRLGLADKPYRGFSIASRGRQHHMEIFARIGVEQRLLKWRDAVREQRTLQDDQPALVVFLVPSDQLLPIIARCVFRLV